jgi:hypothetical protein
MREIIRSEDFRACVASLGGYRVVDLALESIMNGLYHNPYGFHLIENDHVKVRYAITRKIGHIPPLCVCFRIDDDKNVELLNVEEYAAY